MDVLKPDEDTFSEASPIDTDFEDDSDLLDSLEDELADWSGVDLPYDNDGNPIYAE